MSASPPRARPLFAAFLLLLGSTGIAALWTLLSLAWNTQAGWMAVVAAIDAMLIVRLGRIGRRPLRALLALAFTALAIALANWWIAGAQIGRLFGLLPWEAIPRTGLHYAWTLSGMANGPVELAWYVLGLLVALAAWRWP
ncbi:MAG: hypothetical protein Q4F49_02680 [Pseudoxanthomonas suwonensis]|nr:hypothetical protein [Pseudoxanthomonas suwonensis]